VTGEQLPVVEEAHKGWRRWWTRRNQVSSAVAGQPVVAQWEEPSHDEEVPIPWGAVEVVSAWRADKAQLEGGFAILPPGQRRVL